MNYGLWLREAEELLHKSTCSTARIDALALLSFVTQREKATILAHLDDELSEYEQQTFQQLLTRRQNHEPLAYIVGSKEFYGRSFTVTKDVLVPRPETEDMIALLLSLPTPHTIIDVGTGSGAVAITAKLEIPIARVYATDNDVRCIAIAKANARKFDAAVTFVATDLLTGLDTAVLQTSVLLANLPYVPENYPINDDARHEPPEALFSDEHGLGHYRRLFAQLRERAIQPTAVICEALTSQHNALIALAETYGLKHVQTTGLQVLLKPTSAI